MKTNVTAYASFGTTVFVIGCGLFWMYSDDRLGQRPNMPSSGLSAGLRAFNPDDLGEIVPRSSDIFVGRVIEQMGTQQGPGMIDSQFSVDVVSTIKGDAKGRVIINQSGGMIGDTWEIADSKYEGRGDSRNKQKLDEYLIKPGKSYLFVTIRLAETGWYAIYHSPEARTEIDITEGSSPEEIKRLLEKNKQAKRIETILTK